MRILWLIPLSITACTAPPSSDSVYQTPLPNFAASCSTPTKIVPNFINTKYPEGMTKVKDSIEVTNRIMQSENFLTACRQLQLSRTKGKSVEEVCHEFACAGTRTINFDFYRGRPKILGHGSRSGVSINVANSVAGTPGNLAHEFAHVLEYKHTSNFSWHWLNGTTVPYQIGNLVGKLAESNEME
jgi:hypothetical protein